MVHGRDGQSLNGSILHLSRLPLLPIIFSAQNMIQISNRNTLGIYERKRLGTLYCNPITILIFWVFRKHVYRLMKLLDYWMITTTTMCRVGLFRHRLYFGNRKSLSWYLLMMILISLVLQRQVVTINDMLRMLG